MMTNEEVKLYIKETGCDPGLVLDTLKEMQKENAEMSVAELDRRMHPETAVRKEDSPTLSDKKEKKRRKKQKKKKEPTDKTKDAGTGARILTIAIIVLLVLLAILVATILILKVFPDTEAAYFVDRIIKSIMGNRPPVYNVRSYAGPVLAALR